MASEGEVPEEVDLRVHTWVYFTDLMIQTKLSLLQAVVTNLDDVDLDPRLRTSLIWDAFQPLAVDNPGLDFHNLEVGWAQRFVDGLVRRSSEALLSEAGVQAVPFFRATANRCAAYPTGTAEGLVLTMDHLDIAREDALEWKQVLEFRRDTAARRSCRTFMRWYHENLRGKSPSTIRDEIENRLESYEWALKKHGIQTAIGSVEALLDTRQILASSGLGLGTAAVTSSSLLGLLAGVGVIAGKIGLRIASSRVDLGEIRRGAGAEVAYVHELRRRFGGKVK